MNEEKAELLILQRAEDMRYDDSWRQNSERDNLIEKVRCDEIKNDPLFLLRNFVKNCSDLKVFDGITQGLLEKRKVHIYQNKKQDGTVSLFGFYIGVSTSNVKEYNELKKMTFENHELRTAFPNIYYVNFACKTVPRLNLRNFDINSITDDFKDLTGESFSVERTKHRMWMPYSQSTYRLERRLPPKVNLRLDYLIQKFFTGEYDETNPILYGPKRNREIELDESTKTALDILFSGDEREDYQERLKQAQLRVGSGWTSVPRLNLGAIRIPNPARKDVMDDVFVTDAATYLIELFGKTEIMSNEEAEKLMETRLTNYFVHNTKYQHSRQNAKRIVSTLNQSRKAEVA